MTEEALAWLMRLHSGDETANDWAAYEDWKATSAERRAAALRAEALWDTLGSALAPKRGKGKTLPAVLLAALALPVLAFMSGVFGPPASYWAAYQASLGEYRSVRLSDGSIVDLDTATSFDFDPRGGTRTLTLYTGQIFVAVHPDVRRPFVVRTDNGAIRALGTAFDVRRDGGTTTVVVAESSVRVGLAGAAAAPTVDVHAGQQVAYSLSGGLGVPRPAEVQSMTAWRDGKIVFKDRPLGQVVAELSRYHRGMIVILDDELRQLPVTGVFDTDNDDALFDAIVAVAPVVVRKLPLLTVIQRDALRAQGR
jgi:transmembrane sensor